MNTVMHFVCVVFFFMIQIMVSEMKKKTSVGYNVKIVTGN